MIFPLTELVDEPESLKWVERYFHPQGLRCPGCGATTQPARHLRSRKRGFGEYRCQDCQQVYNLYTGTICAGSNLEARRVGLLLQGLGKGESATGLAEELAVSRRGVPRWRKRLPGTA